MSTKVFKSAIFMYSALSLSFASVVPTATAPPDVTQSVYWQCGGTNYDGPTKCASGDICTSINPYYFQCIPSSEGMVAAASTVDFAANAAIQSAYWQCGGENYDGSTQCAAGYTCSSINEWYYQCLPSTAAETNVEAATFVSITSSTTEDIASSTSTTEAATTEVATTEKTTIPTTTVESVHYDTTLVTKANSEAESISASSSSSPSAEETSAAGGIEFSVISGGSSGNGVTTRFWDCCKPSCSWPGKASVSDPVKSCEIDGLTSIDSNTQSGCDGGSSYMCTDQQPFQYNASLALGFAATSITGSSESDTCCSCYLLTFTSGSVSGKQMIVQSINSGSDLGSNQFDIAIPGGGEGIFSGFCESQFGSQFSFGATYGGVSTEAQCSDLPTVLQPGCDWRFDDFADNPSMSFQEVTCPTQLTDITGCIRS